MIVMNKWRQTEDYTIRERITLILTETKDPLTAEEIAILLRENLTTKEIYEHLGHIAKSVRRNLPRYQLVMRPPYCKKCGYVFKDIRRPRKPSKCPRCTSTWIAGSAFIIIPRE